MELTDTRRANLARIFINLGSIIFTTAVVSNFTGSFNVVRLIAGLASSLACFGVAIRIER